MQENICEQRSSLGQKIDFLIGQKVFPVILFCCGAALRLKHYFENRSLWLDEAYLSIDIANTSLFGLASFQTILPGQPRQPVGFLIISKIFTLIFGICEYSLRLFPLLSSLLALYILYLLTKKVLGRNAALLALAIFTFAEPLVYYAAEVKPYSCDVLISLILFFSSINFLTGDISVKKIRDFCLLGIVSMWFSTSSLLVLPAIGFLILCRIFKEKKLELFISFASTCVFFITNFLIIYVKSLSKMLANSSIMSTSIPVFMPRPIWSLSSLHWLLEKSTGIFEHSLGMGMGFGYLALTLLLVGCYDLFKKNRMMGALFLLPLMTFLAANFLHKYPFHYRMLLFLTPCIVIFISQGFFAVIKMLPCGCLSSRILIIAMLIFPSARMSLNSFVKPHRYSNTRPVIKYLSEHYQKGDSLIYNNSAQYLYGFYHGLFRMGSDTELIVKIENWEDDEPKTKIERKYQYLVFNEKGYLRGTYKDPYVDAHLYKDIRHYENNPRTWLFLSQLSFAQKKMTVEFFMR
ncbi:MAG: glycosyltransferase family 39 protein, partial [Candidatus Omnitrophica bacterium]|nr:glycosyltransferase family 39 protein [Candidatus Omnitrophota bacterium]